MEIILSTDLAAVLTVPEVGVDRLREDRLLFARKGNVASSTSTTDSSALDPRAEMFIGHPELFMNVAGALLPVLMRTHTSTVNGNVRIQSLAAICRAIYHMPAPVLELLLRDVPFSAFLAGLLGSKDLQTCSIALFMGNILMGKLPVIFTRYFVKEGVVAEVDNLLTYLATSPSTTTTNPEPTPLDENSSDEGSGDEADGVDGGEGEGEGEGDGDGEEGDDETKNITPTDESLPASATPNPRAKSLKDSVLEQAKSFKGAYFTGSSDSCVSDEVVALRASSSALSHVVSDYVATSTLDAATLSQLEEKLRAALGQIVAHLSAGPSTYEFVESGLTSSLLHYFTCTSMNDDGDNNSIRRRRRQRRVELFAEVFSSVVTTGDGGNSGNGNSNDNDTGEYTGGALLVRQLQQALDKCESLHVLLHSASLTSSLKYLTYPFRFQLQRHPAETSLPELGAGSISVDPLATMGGVRDFLHARLRRQPRSTATAIATSNAATTNASPANASSAPTTTPSPPVADTQAMDVDMDDNNDDGDVDGVDKKAEESSKASDDIDMAEGNEIVEENDDAGDDDELDDLLGVISPALADMEEERSTTGGTMEADIHEIQLSEQQQEDESTVPAPHLAPTPASSAAGAGLWPAETTVDASSSYSVGDIVFLFKNRELKDSDSSFQVAASIGIENGSFCSIG
jgi:E3 ubiquitin-protein ligase TRIP12